EKLGLEIVQGWGMTETGPVGSLSHLTPQLEELPAEERFRVRAKAGRPVPGVRIRVMDMSTGEEAPWDGKSIGEVQITGNWVACVVLKEGATASADELRAHLEPHFAKWWLPERIEFVSEVPKTSVGKFDKKVLRAQFASGG